MKTLFTVISLLLTLTALESCSKKNEASTITGNWRVISDSTYNSGIGPTSPASSQVYRGSSADYFKFTADGKLYINEVNIKVVTADYSLTISNQLNLTYLSIVDHGATVSGGGSATYHIVLLTSHNLTLYNSLLTPGGYFTETVKLAK
jgi:hypothetical protein